MATATIIECPRINLELSLIEIEVLFNILNNVSGDPNKSVRKYVEDIRTAIMGTGLFSVTKPMDGISGNINCYSQSMEK